MSSNDQDYNYRMPSPVNVKIHPSQFPDAVRGELLKSLRTRRVNHKFHYDTIKQAQKWLAVHEAYSPWHNDPNCKVVYRQCFAEAAAQIRTKAVHVIGLGCGSGQKDLELIKLLRAEGKEVFYTPCDSSVAMVLMTQKAAMCLVSPANCLPFVCDVAAAPDLADQLEKIGPPHYLSTSHCRGAPTPTRIVTFFGMIPNFEPLLAMRTISRLVRPGDLLLLNANLVPWPGQATGMEKILPQYDNPLTRDWLMTFLFDLGIRDDDGRLQFEIETGQLGIKRVLATFRFKRTCTVQLEGCRFVFKPTDTTRLFYSYRYTPDQLRLMLARHHFTLKGQWLTSSRHEGVFCCVRT